MWILLIILICLYIYAWYRELKCTKDISSSIRLDELQRAFNREFFINMLAWLIATTIICILYDKI